MALPSPRLLLVEARRPPGLGDSNAEPFPFVAGYAKAQRIPVRWICFAHEDWAPASSAYLFDLTRPARRRLQEHVVACRATHVLFSEVPTRALRSFLARLDSRPRVRHCASPRSYYATTWLVEWLGITEKREGFLPDLAEPSYRALAAGQAPPVAPTPLIGSARCLYSAPLSANPAYGSVDLAGIERKSACAFCPAPPDLKVRYRTPPLEMALRQIAAVRAERQTLCSRSQFIVQSAALFFAMSGLLRRLERESVAPLALFFACRADEVLARAADVADALAIARRCGHEIHVFSMGAENFSPAENERFNKGLTATTIGAALERLRAWEREYPETFFFTRHGGLGFILFTPWTTLEDLRLNVSAARQLGLEEDGFFLTRRLMLIGDTPLTRLAERDGLVDPSDPEDLALFSWLQRYCDPGCRHFFEEQDRSWRFRDPLTARVCAITVRMAKRDAIVEGDPYHRQIAGAVRASGVRLLDAFVTLLALAEEHRDAPLEALLAGLLAWLRRAPASARGCRS